MIFLRYDLFVVFGAVDFSSSTERFTIGFSGSAYGFAFPYEISVCASKSEIKNLASVTMNAFPGNRTQ